MLLVHGFFFRTGEGANPIRISAAGVPLTSLAGPYCGCGGTPGRARAARKVAYLLRERYQEDPDRS